MSDDIRQGWTSASSAEADSLCPGRHLAQRGIPEPPRSEDAASGTRIHQALARIDANGDPEPSAAMNLKLEDREVFDACRKIEKALVLQYFGKESVRVFRHRRNWVQIGIPGTEPPVVLKHSGEADVIFRGGTRLLIIDYKTLMGDVTESPRNLQLRDLGVLGWGALRPVTEVATAIIQPFVTHSPEICIYTSDDLVKAELEMNQRVAASNNPDSPRVAGSPQCDFCLAKTQCVEYQTWAAQLTPSVWQEIVYTAMDKWTPEQATKAAEALAPAYEFLDNVKAWLKEHLPPGWSLKPGANRETIVNPQECYNRFEGLGGKLERFMACVGVGKGKLRDEVSEVTGKKGMELDKIMETLTEGIVEVKPTAPSLKRDK